MDKFDFRTPEINRNILCEFVCITLLYPAIDFKFINRLKTHFKHYTFREYDP